MKGRHFLLAAFIFMLFSSRTVLAQPALEMPVIMPVPNCYQCGMNTITHHAPYHYLDGFYITGQYAYSDNHISNIENVSLPNTAGLPAVVKGSESERSSSPNIALGYQLWHFPFISPRVEVAYLPRIDLNYDANPFLQGVDSSINSTIDSHTILFKLYNDFEFCNFPLIPYIEGGIGRSYTKVESDSTINLLPGLLPPFVGGSNDRRDTRAWDLGLGVKYRFYRSLFLNFGYEYVFLGDDLKWNITYSNPAIVLNPPLFVNLKSGNFTSHNFFAGLTWEPFAAPLS